jgi:hypothetical protein
VNYVTVKIDGKNVEVPTYEVPSLINTLKTHHEQLLATGTMSLRLREEYLSYEECKEILSGIHSGTKLRNHVGKLWGAMCRLTQHGLLHFDTICTTCKGAVEQQTKMYGRACQHNTGIIGYPSILITKKSIETNLSEMMEIIFRGIGPTIISDYRYLIEALAKQRIT